MQSNAKAMQDRLQRQAGTEQAAAEESEGSPSPTLSPTDPVPLGQLWPTGPMVVSATLYIGCI